MRLQEHPSASSAGWEGDLFPQDNWAQGGWHQNGPFLPLIFPFTLFPKAALEGRLAPGLRLDPDLLS